MLACENSIFKNKLAIFLNNKANQGLKNNHQIWEGAQLSPLDQRGFVIQASHEQRNWQQIVARSSSAVGKSFFLIQLSMN